jgi:ABC-2 type transport system permease protein
MSTSPADSPARSGRLSTWQAAYVMARRDFCAILFSRSFIFFLLGPLFPVLVGAFAGGIGAKVAQSADQPVIGIAMQAKDAKAIITARALLAPRMGGILPEMIVSKELTDGERFDAHAALISRQTKLAAVLTGSLSAPKLTGPADRIAAWQGPVSMLAVQAQGGAPISYPEVTLANVATSAAKERQGQVLTAQAAQAMLFLLTMLLGGMVLSNLVEEKGNKIIEILAAAVPMDAVFLGKLFAMLGISFVGITVWTTAGVLAQLVAGDVIPNLPTPAVGWPMFLALGVAYFSMAYLLIGALFLTIGSMASTVREVQTLSMPVTFLQLVFFFIASFAVAAPGTAYEAVAIIVPFSSPYAMLARAAQDPALWPHAAAFAWQVLCIGLFIRTGAKLFRTLVMKSGPAGSKGKKRGLFARLGRKQAAA